MSIERLRGLLDLLEARLKMLEVEEEALVAELQQLPPGGGCTLDYRWVRNKLKVKYWYWYLVCYEDGKRRHIYVGAFPERAYKEREEAKRAREIGRRLRKLHKAKRRIEKLLAKAEEQLAEAVSLLEGVGEDRVQPEAGFSLTPGAGVVQG
ncbi:MAG: hypothetical protein GSR84_08995 [Desulfurococcales archaeon]|nr:hypothetical protein [Desulfurococcales archaeon]